MIVVTVFLSILNRIEIYSVQNQKENGHHDHIPLNLKVKGNIFCGVYMRTMMRSAILHSKIYIAILWSNCNGDKGGEKKPTLRTIIKYESNKK